MSHTTQDPKPSTTSSETSAKNPYVFLSHDTRDADLAEAFAKLLTSVTAGVLKCFRSSDKKGGQGIEYGVEWFPEIMKRLQDASDVVCLLTENSVNRPWILFEAGVAKGKLNTPILGLSIGVPLSSVNTGPFAQFQNSDDEEESVVKLVMQLVRKIPGAEPDESVIKMQVQGFKARCTECLKKKPEKKEAKQTPDESASVAKLFEEIKLMFNDLPARLETTAAPSPLRRKRHRRLPLVLIEELPYLVKRGGPEIGFLWVLAFAREDFPFIYDIGRDLIATIRAENPEDIKDALQGFHDIVDVACRHPIFREMHGDDPLMDTLRDVLHRTAEDAAHLRRKK